MVAVIAFLTIAFLALTRREKGAVTTSTDQTIARLAAEAGLERAQVDLLASMLAFTNRFAFDLRVSTNYINAFGFDNTQPQQPLDATLRHWATNVNFAYPNGTPVLAGTPDFATLCSSLFYDPRPPVFIRTNRLDAPEFRYYLDLNRNGRYDTNGYQPAITWDVANPFLNTNGTFMPVPVAGQTVSNFFVGDPEWIGVLERPEFPHSATNRFVSRYCWIAVPEAKALDVNRMHNNARERNLALPGNDGFVRNQGVGTWELNLGAFLADLNTNFWNLPGNAYDYRTNLALQNLGTGFDDASALLRYRYAGSLNNLKSVQNLFGTDGATAFASDMIDGYAAGPLMLGTATPTVDVDVSPSSRLGRPWAGDENPERVFTTQDFFDPAKNSPAFFDRLWQAGTNNSSYDRYTFYRLLSQLGTDSEPEPPDKMNLNYDNLIQTNSVSRVASVTNFYHWRPIDFFTNAAERMLRVSSGEWRSRNPNEFRAIFGRDQSFGATDIPVIVSNRLVYTPSVHRLLQLAANLYDASTNSPFPSVFRPHFVRRGNDVFITGFEEVSTEVAAALSEPWDIATFAVLRQRISTDPAQPTRTNVYGVPWIVGAKKGLPNFNEMAVESAFQVTRKLMVRRSTLNPATARYETNQMYVLGVTNRLDVELWNSYRTNYPRPVDIYISNSMTMVLTNQGLAPIAWHARWGVYYQSNKPAGAPTGFWNGSGLKLNEGLPLANSFVTASNEYVLLRSSILRVNPPGYEPDTGQTALFERQTTFPVPQMALAVTNRLHAVIVDRGTAVPRIIDYVQLLGQPIVRDLTAEMGRNTERDTMGIIAQLWDARRFNNATDARVPTRGIVFQMDVSSGGVFANLSQETWRNYGEFNLAGGQTVEDAKAYFRAFFDNSNSSLVNTSRFVQVPFSPTRRILMRQSWQANDPLVHYTSGDLGVTSESREDMFKVPVANWSNIGALNERYKPWGGKPGQATDSQQFNPAIKDPLVRCSDDWEFPTNKYPNLGWMGRVHRGTPWQTVYLKAGDILAVNRGPAAWREWAGHLNDFDTDNRAPWSDRLLFDSFTTALSDSAARGRLSINQSGLAAWSALFSGVITVTNWMADNDVRRLKLGGLEARPSFNPFVVEPAGRYEPADPKTWPALVRLVNGINRTRTNQALFPQGVFRRLGDILAVPELTDASPFLNQGSSWQRELGLTDAAYERLPQQVMSLLTVGGPRYVIYSFGQTLRPANNSIVAGGPLDLLCTNYQITAEVATRAVVRVDDVDDPTKKPRAVVESYNVLPPD